MIAGVEISTVTTAPDSYNLVDLATIKTLLDILDDSLDDYFNLIIPQASRAVAQSANNPFVVEVRLDQFWPHRETYPWNVETGVAPLQLSRWPLTAVASVTETIDGTETTLTAGTDYLVDNSKGQLVRLGHRCYPRAWSAHATAVAYSAGYDPVPPDVADAAGRLVKAAYFARLRDPMIRSQSSPGVYESAYWFGNGPGGDSGLPPDVIALLDNYRVPVVG